MANGDRDLADLERELDQWLFADGRGLPLRWWEPGETAERVRARIRELARLTGREIVWVRLDLRTLRATQEDP